MFQIRPYTPPITIYVLTCGYLSEGNICVFMKVACYAGVMRGSCLFLHPRPHGYSVFVGNIQQGNNYNHYWFKVVSVPSSWLTLYHTKGKIMNVFTLHSLASRPWTFSKWKFNQGLDGWHRSRIRSHLSQQHRGVPRTQFSWFWVRLSSWLSIFVVASTTVSLENPLIPATGLETNTIKSAVNFFVYCPLIPWNNFVAAVYKLYVYMYI